jgi:hypothetical protein
MIDLDAVIETPDETVDMKAGLDTLQGLSDAVRCVTETVLIEKVPERKSHKSSVRTSLKRSFKGSYGQIFSIDIYDEDLKTKFRRIGRATFVELLAYYLQESIYEDTRPLSDKAKKIDDKLADKSEQLVQQIRKSMLENIHAVPSQFNHDVKIRFRQSRDEQIVLAKFNSDTALVLDAVADDEEQIITASITRLNINTGNGRLKVVGEKETIPFGFDGPYKDVKLKDKKMLSENLDKNNGVEDEDRVSLNLTVIPLRLLDRKIVKFVVRRLHRV